VGSCVAEEIIATLLAPTATDPFAADQQIQLEEQVTEESLSPWILSIPDTTFSVPRTWKSLTPACDHLEKILTNVFSDDPTLCDWFGEAFRDQILDGQIIPHASPFQFLDSGFSQRKDDVVTSLQNSDLSSIIEASGIFFSRHPNEMVRSEWEDNERILVSQNIPNGVVESSSFETSERAAEGGGLLQAPTQIEQQDESIVSSATSLSTPLSEPSFTVSVPSLGVAPPERSPCLCPEAFQEQLPFQSVLASITSQGLQPNDSEVSNLLQPEAGVHLEPSLLRQHYGGLLPNSLHPQLQLSGLTTNAMQLLQLNNALASNSLQLNPITSTNVWQPQLDAGLIATPLPSLSQTNNYNDILTRYSQLLQSGSSSLYASQLPHDQISNTNSTGSQSGATQCVVTNCVTSGCKNGCCVAKCCVVLHCVVLCYKLSQVFGAFLVHGTFFVTQQKKQKIKFYFSSLVRK